MTATELAPRRATRTIKPLGLLRAPARELLFARLARLREGRIVIHDGDEVHVFGEFSPAFRVSAEIRVRDPRFYREVVLGGGMGAGESYALGYWDSSEPAELVRILVRNRPVLEALRSGPARFAATVAKLAHRLRRNTRSGSRKNIAAHYDLGNEFFATFLDESMTYSAGIFEHDDVTLEAAQTEKLDRLCRKLELSAGDRLCEIGTGWGSLALHAAREYGCHVTTTTISKQQHELARRRIRDAGLEGRVTLLQADYRDLPEAHGLAGKFDKLISIEMIEAVGYRFLDDYFATCQSLLRKGGVMALQAITIAEQFHDAALRSVDFIQRYIFPGAYIPSIGSLVASVGRSTDFRMTGLEDIGPHYARTLADWRMRFLPRRDELLAMGYEDSFLRLFEFYFAYCEGGFRERQLGNAQIVLQR